MNWNDVIPQEFFDKAAKILAEHKAQYKGVYEMKGGILGKVISNPITEILSDVVATATGNPELIPLINGGESAVGGALQGDSIGKALGQGALSGGLSYLGGNLTDLAPTPNTGIGPLDDISGALQGAGQSIGSSLGLSGAGSDGLLSNIFGSAPSGESAFSGAASQGFGDDADQVFQGFGANGANVPGAVETGFGDLGSAAPSSYTGSAFAPAGSSSSSGGASGLLGKVADKVTSNPLTALTLASLVAQNALPAKGTMSAGKLQGIAQNQQASQVNTANNFVGGLNNASLNRSAVNPGLSQADYYTYGSRPEQLFYNNQTTPLNFTTGTQVPEFAHGGFVKGGSPLSGGQDDDIDAKLSNGEYVIPADVVSGLGDGVNDVGAKKLDGFLDEVRQHRLGTKKYPTKAKDPSQYVKMKRGGKVKKKKGGAIGDMYSAMQPAREMRYQATGHL